MEKPIETLRKVRNQVNQAIDKLTEQPDVNKTSYDREYELGTQCMLPNGGVFKYGKIDFGNLGYDYEADKEIRYIWYRWFAMNRMAKLNRHQL